MKFNILNYLTFFKAFKLFIVVNEYYPAEIVKYYSPDYAADLLNKIGGGPGSENK